jgi:hypothetical protein
MRWLLKWLALAAARALDTIARIWRCRKRVG